MSMGFKAPQRVLLCNILAHLHQGHMFLRSVFRRIWPRNFHSVIQQKMLLILNHCSRIDLTSRLRLSSTQRLPTRILRLEPLLSWRGPPSMIRLSYFYQVTDSLTADSTTILPRPIRTQADWKVPAFPIGNYRMFLTGPQHV